MALGFGYNAFIGVGAEGTYGTPVSRTSFLELNSESLSVEDDVIDGNSTFSLTKDVDNFKQSRKKVGGSIEVDLRTQGAEMLLKNAFGTHTYIANGTDTADGTLHTFGIADTLPTGMTIEVNRDVASFAYSGCKINSMTIDGVNEGIVKASFDIISKNEGTTTKSTPTFSTSKYWQFSQCAVTVGTDVRNVEGFSVTLNNNLTDDRYHLGDRTIKEPQRAGRVTVEGEINVEFDSIADWTLFQTAGTAAFDATYTGDTLTGTIKNSLKIACPMIRFKGVPINVGDSGMIKVAIPFEAYSNGTAMTERPLYMQLSNITNGTDI